MSRTFQTGRGCAIPPEPAQQGSTRAAVIEGGADIWDVDLPIYKLGNLQVRHRIIAPLEFSAREPVAVFQHRRFLRSQHLRRGGLSLDRHSLLPPDSDCS